MEILHCIVSGRVQGVGFRYSALSKARSLKLDGWVRNLPDGSVETLAQGNTEHISDYLNWLRSGPPFSAVSNVRIIVREAVNTETNAEAENKTGQHKSAAPPAKSTKVNKGFVIRY